MKATVLFAGAGGSSLGLEQAGYHTVGYEYWKPAADTHNANGMTCHLDDLSHPSGDNDITPCDLLWASPPCQPFSAAGDGEGENDDRDGFPWTLRIIAKLLPPVVIIENVKGVTFAKHADYFSSVLRHIAALGYSVDWRVLNSADYGIVKACPLHDTPQLTTVAQAAETLSQCVAELVFADAALRELVTQPGRRPNPVVTAVARWVEATSRACAGHATCDERQQALSLLLASEGLTTPTGRVGAASTNAGTSESGPTPATAESIELWLNAYLDDLSRDGKLSTTSTATLRTIARRTSRCIAATLTTGLHTGPASRSEGCGLCVDRGIPQTRERCFIIARRDNKPITWPAPTHTQGDSLFLEPWVTMAQALGWDGVGRYDRGEGMNERHGEHPDVVFSERPAPTIHNSFQKNFHISPRPGWWWRGGPITLNYRQTNRDGEPITCDVTDRPAPTVGTQSASQWVFTRPATTIAGDTRVFQPGVHHQPGEQSENAIRLTIAELARLQDFPDTYVWCGTKTDQARQIGNAVPPTMSRVLAEVNRP